MAAPLLASPPPADPVAAADAAGLTYVSDSAPGIHRRRWRDTFRYLDPSGRPLTDEATLNRIRSLAIPPAWSDVWICPSPDGHIQATGRDARGRKQYRYHPGWRKHRDETKYTRMIRFGELLPSLRARVDRDLARPGLPRDKVLATVVRLLETTLIRVGNAEYARDNNSFGLTTMRNRHVRVSGSTVRFAFRGKSGKKHTIDVRDRRLARIVQRCRDIPGWELFQYIDDEGNRRAIGSGDVNAYLREITGEDFTAKDFRTWAGTVLATLALQELEAFDSDRKAKANLVRAVESVASQLGNTPAVCRRCYIHPAVIDAYLQGTLPAALRIPRRQSRPQGPVLHPEEAAVLALLRSHTAP